MSNSYQNAVSLGQLGVQQFHKKNYPDAKDKCVQACRILQKIKNEGSQATKNIVKGYMLQFLTIAEAASQRVVNQPQGKNLSNQNNLFIQQIQSNMIVKADISFEDIVGLDHVKLIIKEAIIYPNMRPDLYKGIRSPPRGILFYGPPGNGKTLMAKAVASECKATFFNVTAASLVSKWVGDSERMLKSIFSEAHKRQPSIIFFDEIDAILTSRKQNQSDASRRLKTEFLVQLDGVSTTDKDRVLLIAATNLPNQLDKAALRRFTKKILIDLPDFKARRHMLQKETKQVQCKLSNSDYNEIAMGLDLYSSADIKNLIRQAVMMPLRQHSYEQMLKINKQKLRPVLKQDFLKAKEICPPTLDRIQYNNYKRFGDEESREGLEKIKNNVSYGILPEMEVLNNYKTNSTQEKRLVTLNTQNLNKTQQLQPIRLKARVIEHNYKRQAQHVATLPQKYQKNPTGKETLWNRIKKYF